MWSPSGLDEEAISPNMDAMITMGTYHYGSYSSSLLEMGANATSSSAPRERLQNLRMARDPGQLRTCGSKSRREGLDVPSPERTRL